MSFPIVGNNYNQNQYANIQIGQTGQIGQTTPFANNFSVPNNQHLQQPKRDEVVLGNQENKMSKKSKLAIGLGVAAAAVGIGYLVFRGRIGAAKQEASKLAEYIEFKPAQTLDEAIQFGKQKLGIKHYEGFDNHEVVNWVNEGLVNVNNAHKGKAKMPNQIAMGEIEKKTLAIYGIDPKYGESIGINENIFRDLDKHIQEILQEKLKFGQIFKKADGKYTLNQLTKNDEFERMINNYAENKAKISFNEKVQLIETFNVQNDMARIVTQNPMLALKSMFKNKEAALKINFSNGTQKSFTLSDIQKMPKNEQLGLLHKLLKSGTLSNNYKVSNPFNTIYHESGHLQHTYSVSGDAYKLYSHKSKPISTVTNDFLIDSTKQELASMVSWYSTKSPSEFVAETYSKLIRGEKVADDIMALYKKYEGPVI